MPVIQVGVAEKLKTRLEEEAQVLAVELVDDLDDALQQFPGGRIIGVFRN